eukprot:2222217-Pleurochrysis_carterae.AAC.1
MVEDGDPNRRTCEQSEAIGVNLKFDLHRRCCRKRKLGASASTHCLRDSGGAVVKQWTQKLTVSRVMQVFRSSCVRESLRRDPLSMPYLQRRDYRIKENGFAPKAEKFVPCPADDAAGPSSIVEQVRMRSA